MPLGLLALTAAAEKDNIRPHSIWQADTGRHFVCLCSKALLATQSSGTAHSRGEGTRELQKLQHCLTLTSSPVAFSTAKHTVPKPLETKQQRRKEKSFSPCRWCQTLHSNGEKKPLGGKQQMDHERLWSGSLSSFSFCVCARGGFFQTHTWPLGQLTPLLGVYLPNSGTTTQAFWEA